MLQELEATFAVLYPELKHTLALVQPAARVSLFDLAFRQHVRKNFTELTLVTPEATVAWCKLSTTQRFNAVTKFIALAESLPKDTLRQMYADARAARGLGLGLYSFQEDLIDAFFVLLNPRKPTEIYTPLFDNLLRGLTLTVPRLALAAAVHWNPAALYMKRIMLRAYKTSRASFFQDELTRDVMMNNVRKKWTN